MIQSMRHRLFAGVVLALASSFAGGFEARVARVIDGDTLVVLADQHQVKIRLAAIDAPEKRQPFGERSRQALGALCAGAQAEVTPQAQDRYGRTVAHVQCRGRDAGAAQVAGGMAWVYRKYSKDGALLRLEREAGAAWRGLWSDPAPVPPWEFRRH